ncbi:MAG TPA: hypothetical protein VE031_09900, partial [Chthoniobacterales bacterium]|nr:hypothetical protein [Chthoniobacterales bacterium]
MRGHRLFLALTGLLIAATTGLGQAPNPDANANPTGNTGALKAQITTGGSYDAHSGNGTRTVTDLRVPGALGDYGLDFTRYWNSLPLDADDPNVKNPSDFGASGWSHSWGWSAVYEEEPPAIIAGTDQESNYYVTSITITFPDGHTGKYKITRIYHGQWLIPGTPPGHWYGPPYSPSETDWTGPPDTHDRLCDMESTGGSSFWLHLADGGSVYFDGGPGGYQAKQVFDPHGLRTDLHYNTNGHLDTVT